MAQTPIPPFDPFGLPAPPWVFEGLLTLTMLLHVLFMNFTLGGAVVATVLDLLTLLRLGRHNLTVRLVWQMLPVTFSFTITTGVAPLLFVQVLFGQFFYTANVLLGFVWFALVPLAIAAFYLVYSLVCRLSNLLTGQLGRWDRAPGKRLLLSLICAILLSGVAAVLTTNHMLSIQPDQWAQQGQWLQNRLSVTPMVTHPRLAHNFFGAVAIFGLGLMAVAWWRRARQLDPPEITTILLRTGLWVFLPTAATALVFGVVFFFLLPSEVSRQLLSPQAYSILWWIGLLAVIGQLVVAALALQQPQKPRWFAALAAGALVTLVGMICGREQVRLGYLEREGLRLRQVWGEHVNPQPSSLWLFAITLVLALGTLVWLLWVSARAPRSPAATPADG